MHTTCTQVHTQGHTPHRPFMRNEKVDPSHLPLQPAAASYLPLVSEEGEYCIALFFMFSVNPGGEITKPGDRRLWQMENLSEGIMMPPDLLSFPFLLEPRYQWSVSDGGALVPRRASLRGGWNSLWWPLRLCQSQLSGDTMTLWWHLKCTLLGLVTAVSPTAKKS